VRKYFGRLLKGTRSHLIEIARLLDFPLDLVQRMRTVKDEESEALFLAHIEGKCGGPVDWRGGASDIYEVLEGCLSDEERGILSTSEPPERLPPAQIVKWLDSHLTKTKHALRALDSLGDFIIVLVVPRERVSEFDHAARYWKA